MTFEEFPDYDIFLENLSLLYDKDFSSNTYDEIRAEYFKNVIAHHSMGGHFTEENIPNINFYRVRSENSISPNQHLDLIQTYSYPPANICKNGRANIQGHSVFYCTDDSNAAIKESRMVKDEVGYLSIWRLRLNRELRYSVYMPENLPDLNTWTELSISIVKAV